MNNELKQQGDGAGEHLNYDKLRVAGHGSGNTRARRTNTANCAPNMLMHHRHVSVPVCTISILWNFHTNPYQPSETTSCNNRVTVPVKPQERQITSCRARGGQHARPSHKHCKACAKHAHAPRSRVCTGLHDFHLVEFYTPTRTNPVKQRVETTG